MLLGTMLVSGSVCSNLALAQTADSDPYPYCRAVDLPSALAAQAQAQEQAAQAAKAAQTGQAANSTPAAGAAAPASGAASAPPTATAPTTVRQPTLVDQLKSSTDANKIVDTLLDTYGPTSVDYGAVFEKVVYQVIADNYVDVSKVNTIANLPTQYRGKIKTREDLDRAVYDLVQKLGDPATSYISAPDKLTFDLRASIQKLAFFGARLKVKSDGGFEVSAIVPGSTAELGGFRVGDTILSINGKSLQGLNKTSAEELELQPIGNQLEVVSEQDGSKVDQQYMLQQFVPYKPAMQVLPEQMIYIKMPTTISDQAVGAVVQNLFKAQMQTPGGVAGIVLDLRYVDDASVQTTRALLPYLIGSGVVLHEQKRQGRLMVDSSDQILPLSALDRANLTADQLKILQDIATMPMVILINGSTTATGAEQLAIALRDGRPNVNIVGEHIHGNGVEAASVRLPNCGVLTVTTTRYTTATGAFLGDVGITPDYQVVPSRKREDGDVQLARAVAIVRSQSAYRAVNLVTTDAVSIPALGPPPKMHTDQLGEFDRIKAEQQHKLWLVQGLVALALLLCPGLYLLLARKSTSARKQAFHPRNGG